MTGPRIYLVTNDASRCARELWCHPGNLPPSIAIADNIDLMMRIPNGVAVRCYWYGSREELEPWENCWWSRRVKGGFEWVSQEDWERIMQWAEASRKAPDLKLLLGIDILPEKEAADAAPAAASITAEDHAVPPAAIIAGQHAPAKRGRKWT